MERSSGQDLTPNYPRLFGTTSRFMRFLCRSIHDKDLEGLQFVKLMIRSLLTNRFSKTCASFAPFVNLANNTSSDLP